MKLYYEGCVQMPGPRGVEFLDTNAVAGVILHSAEGYEPGIREQLTSRQVSWHFTVFRDGHVEQHYPLTASCWHAGSKAANLRLIGVEHEGVAGQPLTTPQLAASVTLTRWIAEQGGWHMGRAPGPAKRLYEHREVNPATTCPNGRIPWGYYLEEDGMVTHKLSDPERTTAGRAIGHGAGLALAGVDGRSVEQIIDIDTPPGAVDYRLRVLVSDAEISVG